MFSFLSHPRTLISRQTGSFLHIVSSVCVGIVLWLPWSSHAATDTWTNANGGSWSNTGNWSGGNIPSLTGDVADFSTLALTSGQTVTLDANQTAGTLIFGDASASPASDWTLANGAGGPWTLTLSVASGSPVISVVNRSATITAVLAGTSGFTKTGVGNLVLAAANTYTGATLVNGGKLTLDFGQATAPASNIIDPSSTLTLAGSTLSVIGKASTTNSQTFGGLTLNAGASAIIDSANATANPVLINLGAITRNVGGVIDFTLPTGIFSATNGITTSTVNTSGGILGGWATVGGTTWATNNGTNVVGLAAAAYTTTTAGGTAVANYTGKDVDVTVTRTIAGAVTLNSLRFNSAGAFNFTLAAGTAGSPTVNVISSGGILVTSAVGANTSTIGGGANANISGAAGKDLVVIQNNTAGILNINAVIADNSGATGLTKAGAGTLQITRAATYTGGAKILAGTILLNISQALANGGAVTLGDAGTNTGGTLDLNTFNQTVGALTAVGTGPNIITNSGATASTLTISAASTFNGIIQNGVGGVAVTKSNGGVVSLSGANTFTGNLQVNNGTIRLIGGDNRLSTSGSVLLGNGGANSGILQLGDANGASNQTLIALALTAGDTGLTNQVVGGNATQTSTLTLNIATTDLYQGLLGNGTAGSSAANNLALVKTGAGTLTLGRLAAATAVNTFIGGTTINQGTIALGYAGALTSTGAVTLNGGTLDLAGFSNTVATVTLKSGSIVDSVGGGVLSGSSYDVRSGLISAALGDGAAPSALTKTTSGTVILSGVNSYTGGTNINEGTLALGANNTLMPTGAVNINGGSLDLAGFSNTVGAVTLTSGNIVNSGGAANLNASSYAVQSGTVSAVLAGTGSTLTKSGAGTVTLSAANTYTGATTISGGTLVVTTAQTGGGAFGVNDSAALTVKVAAAGQSLVTSALTLGSSTGGILNFDLGTLGNPTAPILSAGSLSLLGNNIINVSGSGLGLGEFALISYTGAIAGGGSLTLGTLPARITASLDFVTNPQQVLLNVTAFDVPKWTGMVNGNWDIDDGSGAVGTLNWKLSNNSATGYYQNGPVGTDSVLFDNSAANKTVNLTTTLTPNAVTVNNDSNPANTYTFTGTGKLSGTTTLTKQGTGTLILANTGANDFTGDITISGGVLQSGDGTTVGAGVLGTGLIHLNGGTLTLNRPVADDFTLANNIDGNGVLRQAGGDIVTVSGNNALFSGSLVIAGGALKVGSLNALGTASITVQTGGVFDLTGFAVANSLVVSGGALKESSGGASSLSGGIILSGGGVVIDTAASSTLTLSGPISGTGGLLKSNSGLLVLSGNDTYAGVTTINAGTVQLGGATALGSAVDGTVVASGAVLDVAGFAVAEPLQINGGTLRSSTGAGGAVSGSVTLGASGGIVDAATSATLTLSSSVSGAGALTKNSGGTLVLSGNNGYSGGTILNAGTLQFSNASALPATGSISAAAGTVVGFGFALDQSTLSRISTTANAFTVALGANTSASLDFTNYSAASLGAYGSATYAGVLTPNGTTYRLGGGGGTLTVSSQLTGANSLSVGVTGAGTVLLTGANTFTGGTTILGGTLQLGGATALGSAPSALTVTTGTLDLNGHNFTVSSLAGAAAGTITDNGGPDFGISYLTVNIAAGASSTYSGTITEGTFRSVALVKAGAGTLVLNKANGSSYLAGTFLNGGILDVRDNNAQVLPSDTDITFTGTSILRANNNGTASPTLALGALSFEAGFGTVSNYKGSTGSGATLIFSGALSRANGAAGNFSLDNGATAPGYKFILSSGAITPYQFLNGGVYYQGNDFAAYDPSAGVRAVDYVNDDNVGNVVLASDQTTLAAGLGKSAAGLDVQLGGSGNITTQSNETLNSLKIAGSNNLTLDVGATLTISSGGLLKAGGNAAVISGGAGITTGGAGDLVVRTAAATDTLTIGTSILASTTGGVTKTGLGTLILSSNNSYSGVTTILEGTLQIGSATALGGLADGTLVETGGTLDLAGLTTAENLSFDGGTLRSSTGSGGSVTGSVQLLAGGGTLDAASGATLNLGAVISGSGGLTKSTSLGTVILTGANTFTGNVTVSGGILDITSAAALGVGPKVIRVNNAARGSLQLDGSTGNIIFDSGFSFALSSDGTVNTAGAIVNIAGNNVINGNISLPSDGGGNGRLQVLGGTLTVNGNIDANGATSARLLLLGGTGNGVIHGIISNFNATATTTMGVTKDGSGTWVLTANNTYTGATTISGGILELANTASITSNATVATGGALVTAGTINGKVTVQSGGKLYTTEAAATGLAIVNGSITVNSGADWYFDLGGTARGAVTNGYDAVNGLTQLTLSGTLHLTLVNGYAPVAGDSFNLLDWSSLTSGNVNGTGLAIDFSGASLGSGLSWDTSNFLTSGIVSVAGVAPEPARVVLLGLGGLALFLRRRRPHSFPLSKATQDTTQTKP